MVLTWERWWYDHWERMVERRVKAGLLFLQCWPPPPPPSRLSSFSTTALWFSATPVLTHRSAFDERNVIHLVSQLFSLLMSVLAEFWLRLREDQTSHTVSQLDWGAGKCVLGNNLNTTPFQGVIIRIRLRCFFRWIRCLSELFKLVVCVLFLNFYTALLLNVNLVW